MEVVISHLKYDHRVSRNYLKGILGDSLNALLSGIGFNLRLLLREVAFFVSNSLRTIIQTVSYLSQQFLLPSSGKSY